MGGRGCECERARCEVPHARTHKHTRTHANTQQEPRVHEGLRSGPSGQCPPPRTWKLYQKAVMNMSLSIMEKSTHSREERER